jgi:hypothetical protein
MKKAAIDENNHTASLKKKIGRPWKVFGANAPAAQAGSHKH